MTEQLSGERDTFTIIGPNGASEEVNLPAGLGDAFAEDEENPTAVAADFLIQAFAQQTHAVVHHSRDEPPAGLVELDEYMELIFEERFDVSLAEAMGHDH
jgi:hypothetical protein